MAGPLTSVNINVKDTNFPQNCALRVNFCG
jgi:hypothetical protein